MTDASTDASTGASIVDFKPVDYDCTVSGVRVRGTKAEVLGDTECTRGAAAPARTIYVAQVILDKSVADYIVQHVREYPPPGPCFIFAVSPPFNNTPLDHPQTPFDFVAYVRQQVPNNYTVLSVDAEGRSYHVPQDVYDTCYGQLPPSLAYKPVLKYDDFKPKIAAKVLDSRIKVTDTNGLNEKLKAWIVEHVGTPAKPVKYYDTDGNQLVPDHKLEKYRRHTLALQNEALSAAKHIVDELEEDVFTRRFEKVELNEVFGVEEDIVLWYHDAEVDTAVQYQDATVQCQEEYHQKCNYCGTTVDASSNAPPCGTILCAECTSNYVSTLFDRPPTGVGVPCPCDCGATLTWSHVARSVPDDVMTRLVCLYIPVPPPPDPPPDLGSIVRRTLEEASNLCAPCCGAVIDDFDNCFSVTCRACAPTTYFCAWCLTYTSSSSDECHAHVRDCDENPHRGAVYGNMEYWLDVHRVRKRRRSLTDAVVRARDVITEARNALL